ncbi:MAG: PDZ domain-containing protein [Alphaproteobacteria bacterium]|nr:PDZ domain-containing protein [Alphaproteobacteria bacterium]
MTQGYYRYPAVYKNTIVFVSEEDLWQVSLDGGIPRRLTTGLGAVTHPVFSPDGKWIAFAGTEEGNCEVYVMPSEGGQAERITYLGDQVQVVNWTNEGIFFSSSSSMPFSRVNQLFKIDPLQKQPQLLPLGPASHISYSSHGKTVIQRHGYREYGYWKRYRGGTAGNLWIDQGDGNYHELIQLKGNLFRPIWIGERIYFVSDHDGIGNVYSCLADARDVQQHTFHKDYYVRYIYSDGATLVYNAGGDLFQLNIANGKSAKVEVLYNSPRTQRNRKFVSPSRYLEAYSLSPRGDYMTVLSRGKAFCLSNWEGPVLQLGSSETARYRNPVWLNDGVRILIVSDECGDECLEIYHGESLELMSFSKKLDLGRILEIKVSPTKDEILLSNHRCELIHVDLKNFKMKILDRSPNSEIQGFDWSPDGLWAAYSCAVNPHQWILKMVDLKKGTIVPITKPVLKDMQPSFDPDGKYLYFLSCREFNPYRDSLHFEYSFPNGMKPFLITLRKDITNPFVDRACDLSKKEEEEDEDKKKKSAKQKPLQIDFDGIENRVIAFPVDEGLYSQIEGLKGKVLISVAPLDGTLGQEESSEPDASDTLYVYEYDGQKLTAIKEGISDFAVNQDRSSCVYRVGNRLRVGKAGEKIDSDPELPKFSKKNGWIDLSRMKLLVDPVLEWKQMYREAWRLQRDHFWREDMAKVNWNKVYELYEPLLDRIGTREELSDLIWEMQGELGASHAYVFGGDVRYPPHFGVAKLAADFTYDDKYKAYRITNIARGDSWQDKFGSPLCAPGLNIEENDLLVAINGRLCDKDNRPETLLMNQSGQEVQLTVSDAKGKQKRSVIVQTLRSQYMARYREWVEKNRAYVHKKSGGKIGYIHVPDMGPLGYSEFHRGFLGELDREGLVVDVRFNGGGHVSQLLIEKLARRRLGYDQCRWFGLTSYPEDAAQGPMVCLTNEYAGSDGDMFSHVFKMMKLGPLLGKRTWGGVIGIWPRHALVDGGMTTQPEFSFWFKDVGWGIENYGVDPDIEVEFRPQDYVAGKDPQLDRSIEEVQKIMNTNPPLEKPVAA